jgi:hypothetical protein
MATRINRALKLIAFNANGIGGKRYELSKQLQDLHVDVALFSETHLEPSCGRFLRVRSGGPSWFRGLALPTSDSA